MKHVLKSLFPTEKDDQIECDRRNTPDTKANKMPGSWEIELKEQEITWPYFQRLVETRGEWKT